MSSIKGARLARAGTVTGLAVGVLAAAGFNSKAELVYGVSDQFNDLVSFDSATPGALKSAIALTGMAAGEQIRGIDWLNGVLYGLGDQSHLYTINTSTGVATAVGSGSFSPVLNGIEFGFNSSPSLLYVASDLGQSLSLNPVTGATTVLPSYTGASLDAIAYNYVNSSFLGLSASSHDLYTINPLTGGTTLIGGSGVNFAYGVGLDVSPTTGTAYFSGTVGGQTEFYTVNTTTGAFTLVGGVGPTGLLTSGLNGIAVTGITAVPEPTSMAFLALGGLSAVLLRRRK